MSIEPTARVGELKLHLRTRDGYRPGVRADAERFTRSVLERVAVGLDTGGSERMVFIRELSLRWLLQEHQLVDGTVVDVYARKIHDRLAQEAPVDLEITAIDVEKDVAVFENESHWRAAHWLARSRGVRRRAWFFERLEAQGDPAEALAAPGKRTVAWEVLERLATHDRLAEVMGESPRPQLLSLAERLLDGRRADESPPLARLQSAPSPVVSRLMAVVRRLPKGIPAPVVSVAMLAHARVSLGPISGQVDATVAESLARLSQEGLGDEPPGGVGERQSLAQSTLDASDERKPVDGAASDWPTPDEGEPAAQETIAVDAGGLFYLLNCALELDVGEALWMSCLPETTVLAHAFAGLLRDELADDASVALIAGCTPDSALPPVSEEQLHEVSDSLLAALSRALPRRSLAVLPQSVLGLQPHGTDRLLVARALDSPFGIFARPASTPELTRAALEAFLAGWSRRAPVSLASPGLAELDTSGRVRPSTQAATQAPALLPDAGSAVAGALLAQTVGVMGCLLQARSDGWETTTVEAFVDRYLRLPARVRATHDTLTVVIPANVTSVELRRAGLDRDPGWVSWLQKTIRFEFQDGTFSKSGRG